MYKGPSPCGACNTAEVLRRLREKCVALEKKLSDLRGEFLKLQWTKHEAKNIIFEKNRSETGLEEPKPSTSAWFPGNVVNGHTDTDSSLDDEPVKTAPPNIDMNRIILQVLNILLRRILQKCTSILIGNGAHPSYLLDNSFDNVEIAKESITTSIAHRLSEHAVQFKMCAAILLFSSCLH